MRARVCACVCPVPGARTPHPRYTHATDECLKSDHEMKEDKCQQPPSGEVRGESYGKCRKREEQGRGGRVDKKKAREMRRSAEAALADEI